MGSEAKNRGSPPPPKWVPPPPKPNPGYALGRPTGLRELETSASASDETGRIRDADRDS